MIEAAPSSPTHRMPRPGAWGFPNPAGPPGSATYFCLKFSPPALRHDLARLTAWRYLVQAIPRQVSDPGVARLKLLWWRDEARLLVDGFPSHPLNQALQPLIAKVDLPITPFLRLADQVEAEILRQRLADSAALSAACEADLGGLFELMARVQGCHDKATLEAARRLGAFCALVYRIRDSGWLARQGRAPIPMSILGPAGLTPTALFQAENRARLPEWLPQLASQARALLDTPTPIETLPTGLRLWVRILSSLLDELEAIAFQVADQRVSLTPLRKFWLAWRENRQRQRPLRPPISSIVSDPHPDPGTAKALSNSGRE